MIIGAIIETGNSTTGAQSSGHNGAALIQFITWNDAVKWARIQSSQVVYGTDNMNIKCLTTIINTDTEEKQWWYLCFCQRFLHVKNVIPSCLDFSAVLVSCIV